ncbi:hypothetical protein [Streptomyces sp. NPDC093260]|uniref:hypothetical protein n=1 Tax=Streptomyces sp. NPDC093260 TaxID=3155073 RepID=UPI0034419E32
MTTQMLHGDLCPRCGRPLTLQPTTVVRSNVPYPITRADYLPYCDPCASDLPNAQEWNDLMNARYGS